MVMNSVDGKRTTAGFPVKAVVSSVVLGAIYLLCAVRYYPGRFIDTLMATVEHLLTSLPFALGLTLVVISVFARLSGQRPPRLFTVRLFLTFGIIIEFFFGLYHYLSVV